MFIFVYVLALVVLPGLAWALYAFLSYWVASAVLLVTLLLCIAFGTRAANQRRYHNPIRKRW